MKFDPGVGVQRVRKREQVARILVHPGASVENGAHRIFVWRNDAAIHQTGGRGS